MKLHRLALIGTGQIGLRHLQALTLIDHEIAIEVVDPSNDSLNNAKVVANAMTKNNNIKKIDFYKEISSLSNNLDLVIIATDSKVRYEVTKSLLREKNVKYLILEKILFQKLEHFSEIEHLLYKNDVKAWVNCPLRTIKFNKNLKNLLAGSTSIEYNVSYSHIGLGSNAVHHLDLFSYLTGRKDIQLDTCYLDDKIIPSKRSGFIEFSGKIFGFTPKGDIITISSYPIGDIPPLIQITSDRARAIIKPTEEKALLATANNDWLWEEVAYQQPYQSQLTHLVAQEILTTGSSSLTPYTISWQLHLPLLKGFMEHLRRINEDGSLCPIT